jgi:hypothetical protein
VPEAQVPILKGTTVVILFFQQLHQLVVAVALLPIKHQLAQEVLEAVEQVRLWEALPVMVRLAQLTKVIVVATLLATAS